jgi:hypothetical protein
MTDEPRAKLNGRTLMVALWYPRTSETEPNAIEIDLADVRASDGLRIDYDYDRDGWSIKQPTKLEFEQNEDPDLAWSEVAFCKSWANNLDKVMEAEPDVVMITTDEQHIELFGRPIPEDLKRAAKVVEVK